MILLRLFGLMLMSGLAWFSISSYREGTLEAETIMKGGFIFSGLLAGLLLLVEKRFIRRRLNREQSIRNETRI